MRGVVIIGIFSGEVGLENWAFSENPQRK